MNPTPNTTTTESDAATGKEPAENEQASATPEADGLAAGTPDVSDAPDDADATDDAGASDAADPSDGADEQSDDGEATVPPRASSGVAVAAAAVVAVALGVVSLTGTWTGRVGAERETLVGQLHTSQTSSASQQIGELYGDGWHTTAAINGVVALVAAIVAVIVLFALRRATAVAGPARTNAGTAWVKPVAVAALVLGAIGVLVSLGMYFDLFAALPTAPATPTAPPAG